MRLDLHGRVGRILTLGLPLLVIGGLLVFLVGMTFSFTVKGNSMEPTLDEGDRLMIAVLDQGPIERFDVVETRIPGGGGPIVKRVIALPGDQVSAEPGEGEPRVLIRPAGSDHTYAVDSDAWRATYDGGVCCEDSGRASSEARWTTVPADSFWVIGDNWSGSTDSRSFGWVTRSDIQGKVWIRVQPLADLGGIEAPRLVRQD